MSENNGKDCECTALRALLDNLEFLTFVLDEYGQTILYANAAFMSFMQSDVCDGKTVAEFIAEDEDKKQRRASFLGNIIGCKDPSRGVFCPEINRWFKLSVNPLNWNGSPAQSYMARDITDDKRVEDLRLEKDMAYDTFTKKFNVTVWEYNKETHTVIMIQRDANNTFGKFGLPNVIEDVPYSLVSNVDDRDIDKFVRMYTSIDAGMKKADAKIMLTNHITHDNFSLHIILSSFTDYLGREKIIGVGIDISASQREEEKYRRLKKQLSDVMEISYESALLDLAQNRCHEHKCLSDTVLRKHESTTADGFIYAIGMDIGDPKLQSEFFDRFSIESMLLDFNNGIQQLYMEFPTASSGLEIKWLRITANLSMNPETDSVEALTYLMDISEEKKHSFIVKSLASGSFHFIAFVYADTKEVEFFSNSTDIYYIPGNVNLTDYDNCRKIRAENFIMTEEERKAYIESSQIEVIRKELKNKSSYAISLNQTVAGKNSHLQIIYSWAFEEMDILLALCVDITESYIKEQEYIKGMEKAVMEAEKAAKSKMEFISRISHDIRTPLSAITSMTEFAFEDIDDREKLIGDLEKINSSNHFLMSLINDVLDVSKIDSGRIELIPELYYHDDFIEDIKNMFVPLCDQKGVKFTVIDTGLEVSAIYVDKVRLNQIVLNLISNAYKYTPKGGSITLTLASRRMDEKECLVDITVADTGIGMGEDFQKKMFTPFSQDLGNPERQKLRSGTGIGLYIVKKLVNLMGGTIDVESELHKGTKIHMAIRFPYEAGFRGKSHNQAVIERKPLSGRVLLAEDNEINVEIALRTLHAMGLEADTAENGAIALKRFKECSPGTYICILMDIQMPILSGYEATEAIRSLDREDAKTIPIFALSANAYSEAVQQSEKSGMNGHISKPIDKDALYKALLQASEQAKADS
ncbi:MAG: response regulator [Treponema sp.]|nr:response regulator [Treponema sp.]